MKLRQLPEDFQVEELTDLQAGAEGSFALYRLDKSGWTTPDALAVVRRRWQIPPSRLSYGGLKDRHARTTQYFTIYRGPRRTMRQQQIEVAYLGQLPGPYTSEHIRCNRFALTLRALAPAEARAALERLPLLEQGVPNYFDDQRFGSVSAPGQPLVARLLVEGRFEDALRLALTAPYEHDRAAARQEKQKLRAHWGDWARLAAELPRGHARQLVDFLRAHPGDFRGAVARLHPELRGLYLAAYQSHLWNRMLALTLRRWCRPDQLEEVAFRLGSFPVHAGLDPDQLDRLRSLLLPLPSARLHLDPEDPRGELVQAVLDEERLALKDLRVKGIRELFFSRGERAALVFPAGLRGETRADALHAGKQCLILRFELPRGSYATLVVKRLLSTRPRH